MMGHRNPGHRVRKQPQELFAQSRLQWIGACTHKSGFVHGSTQTNHVREMRKLAFKLLADSENLPLDGIAGHRPLDPALGQQSAYHWLVTHSTISGKNMVRVARMRIPAVQGKVQRFGQNRPSKNSLELRPGLKPPHA